jgi:hypothetical protein
MSQGGQKVCEQEKYKSRDSQETYKVDNGDGEDGQLIAFVVATH